MPCAALSRVALAMWRVTRAVAAPRDSDGRCPLPALPAPGWIHQSVSIHGAWNQSLGAVSRQGKICPPCRPPYKDDPKLDMLLSSPGRINHLTRDSGRLEGRWTRFREGWQGSDEPNRARYFVAQAARSGSPTFRIRQPTVGRARAPVVGRTARQLCCAMPSPVSGIPPDPSAGAAFGLQRLHDLTAKQEMNAVALPEIVCRRAASEHR